ncbi:MAG: DUF1801 domain-containing protein [Bacteroidales bacterium]|nr:DUF1801 domain-containing protein [Bacteroidales bacterium]
MIKKSNDIETQKFIENIKVLDYTKYQILKKLREIVFDNFPKVKERIMYGGIMFFLNEDFGGVFVYENHISFEFSYGYKFDDSKNLLEGKGKYRRHLKLRSLDDIETKKVDFFVKQIKEIEN